MALSPNLLTKHGLVSPQVIVKNPQLSGQNPQLNVQAITVVYPQGAPVPRLPGTELRKRLQAKLSPQFLVRSLQNYYLSQETLSIFKIKAEQEWELKVPLEEIYVRLAIIENQERKIRDQALDKHSDRIQDDRIPTYETIYEPKQNIELEKLFEHKNFEEKDRKRIYLQGAAGSGKSTLCHYIAYSWAKGELWQGLFSCLFWIPLRNLTLGKYPPDKDYTPAGLIAREYAGKIDPRVIEACINNAAFRKKTLFILDGYDELSSEAQGNSSLAKVFKELKELFPHILITSRPGSCFFDRSCEIELLGFDKKGIGRYIDRFFTQVKAEEKKEKFCQLLKNSPYVANLAQIPLHLTLLCCLFNEDPELFDAKQSITMTAIYERMISWMYKWFILRRIDQGSPEQNKEQILAEKNLRLNPKVAEFATAFEEMADFAMKNDTLYLSKQEIESFRGNKLSSNELADCGLMRIPEERGYFIHLTFQEFLTASKVANQYLTLNKKERQACQQFVRKYKFEPRYNLVLRMIAGYLSLAVSNNRLYLDSNPLQQFFDDLFAGPYDLAVRNELTLIAQCFEECQNPSVVSQYKGFVKLLKDYIKYLCRLGLEFDQLLSNKDFLSYSAVVHSVEELLAEPEITENMLGNLERLVSRGHKLTPNIIEWVIQVLRGPNNSRVAENLARNVLRKAAEQKGGLSQEVLVSLIHTFREGENKDKDWSASALTAAAEQGELPKKAIAALIHVLEEGNVWAKGYAASVLDAAAKEGGTIPQEALTALIDVLKEGEKWPKRCATFALGALVKQGGMLSQEALAALVKVLKEGEEWDKVSAVLALEAIGKEGGTFSQKALTVLIDVLKEGDIRAKPFIASSLGAVVQQGGILSQEVLAALIAALKKGEGCDKASVALALGVVAKQRGMLSQQALAALIDVLKEGKESDRVSVASALEVVAKQGETLLPELLVAFIHVLKEGKDWAKPFIASMLGTMAKREEELSQQALAILIHVLKEGKDWAKGCAASALGAAVQQGEELPEEVLVVLIDVLKKGEDWAKPFAASSLGNMIKKGKELPEEALIALIDILKKGNGRGKDYAAHALGLVAKQRRKLPEEALDALINILKESGTTTTDSIAFALGAIVKEGGMLSEKALDALIHVLKEGENWAKGGAAFALEAGVQQGGVLPEKALNVLIHVLKEREGLAWAQEFAASALGTVAKQGIELPQEALSALIRLAREGKDGAQGSAVSALAAVVKQGKKLPKELLASIIQALEKDESWTRDPAASKVGTVIIHGMKLSKEELFAFIQALKKGDNRAKNSAASALGAVAKQGGELAKELLTALIQIVEEGDVWTKKFVAQALKKADRNAFLKIDSKAFVLVAELCFFTADSMYVQNQQIQISDKRAAYSSGCNLELSYDEIRKKLPSRLREWREKVDKLS
ncbi:NACHT domain-containing protein [Parachlamydia sp. AcF125]|uniref:NACHT domain-containing protein n=1 Tax=Parachlamydia sp. AcF125 TaxID=2795736 RepID=UPI001BC9CEE6|nr:NACHT domain-containing protein [Parachlamydia sp. AcF125]MBS4169087.1 hypothetical protein [Parachlamydia sp. AcF125]